MKTASGNCVLVFMRIHAKERWGRGRGVTCAKYCPFNSFCIWHLCFNMLYFTTNILWNYRVRHLVVYLGMVNQDWQIPSFCPTPKPILANFHGLWPLGQHFNTPSGRIKPMIPRACDVIISQDEDPYVFLLTAAIPWKASLTLIILGKSLSLDVMREGIID